MITYRGVVKTGSPRSRNMLPPAFRREARRASKSLTREAGRAMAELLRLNYPEGDSAEAWFEVSDRHGLTVLARWQGHVTRRDPTSGKALAGEWTLTTGRIKEDE